MLDQTTSEPEAFQEELLRLRNEVQALAQANVHAGELMAELKEARELEEILKANNAQLQRARRMEEDRARYLELVAKNQPAEALLRALGEFLMGQDPTLAFSFLLAPQGELKHAHTQGLPPQVTRGLNGAQFYLVPGIREAMTSKRPFTVLNLAHNHSSDEFLKLVRINGYRALYCWPVLNPGGRILGLVLAYGRKALDPSPELRELLQQAVTLFAMGVDHRLMTERLTFQAHHDTLTSLPNRNFSMNCCRMRWSPAV